MARVVVQAGHYPRKSGATGTGGVDGDPTEQEFTLPAAKETVRLLVAAGHSAGWIGADVPDSAYRGDVFIAIHCDGSTNPSARGASVGYRTPEGQRLATSWKRAYAAEGWDGGWRPDNYTDALAGHYGTGNAVGEGNRFSIIVEAGFLTNPANEAKLSLPNGPKRLARSLVAAVNQHFAHRSTPEEDDMNEAQYLKALSEPTSKIRKEHKEISTGALVDALRPKTAANPDHGAARGLVADIAEDAAERALRKVLREAGLLPVKGPDASPSP